MDILKTFAKYVLFLLLPLTVFAQAPSPYHRFGTVLSRGSNVSANVVPYANITVCVAGSNPCTGASIYYDVGLTSPILGPVVADPSGNFSYYLSGNQCVDEYYTSPSITAYTIPNVCSSYVNNNTGSSTNGQALVNLLNSVAGRNIADGGTIATLTTVLPLTGGTLTGTLNGPTINATTSLTTPSFTLNGGVPITSQSSSGNQVVTCPPGGTGSQYCNASGAWTNPGTYTLPPPTLSTLGGLFSSTAPTNRFATGVDTSGNVLYTQPTYANLGGSVPIWNQNTTGNSGTTNSFAAVPTNCGATGAAYGIDSSGNALCTPSTSASGYAWVGGILIQWVSGATQGANFSGDITTNWPIAFPTGCLTVQLTTHVASDPTGNGSAYTNYLKSCSTTQVVVYMDVGPDSVGSVSHNYIALGIGD